MRMHVAKSRAYTGRSACALRMTDLRFGGRYWNLGGITIESKLPDFKFRALPNPQCT
jgi:hypothetical protein